MSIPSAFKRFLHPVLVLLLGLAGLYLVTVVYGSG